MYTLQDILTFKKITYEGKCVAVYLYRSHLTAADVQRHILQVWVTGQAKQERSTTISIQTVETKKKDKKSICYKIQAPKNNKQHFQLKKETK